jgi:hypothetical protein
MKFKRVAYAMVAGVLAASGYLAALTSSPAAAAVTPTVTTQASFGGPVGTPVTDTATVTGQNPTGTVTFTLYGPDDATCANAPAFTSPAAALAANGTATSASFAPTAPGVYRWRAAYSGDVNNNPLTPPCNAPNESVTIVTSTDLAITASGPASTNTNPGSQVTIAVHVVNNGPNPTSQGTIVITTTLPTGVVLASGTGGGFGCTTSGQTVTCSRADPLAPGGALDMTLVLTITDPNLTAFNLLLQVADPKLADPNGANNSASVSATLNRGSSSPNSSGFDPNWFVRECLATCSVENNHQDSTLTVTDPGAPQSERDRDRAERDADRAADRGEAKADPASGALAASGTAKAPAAAGAAPASSSRIPFTGAPVQRLALSALVLLILGSMLINNARSAKALEATASGRARWRHRRRR